MLRVPKPEGHFADIPGGLEYVSSWVDLEFKTCYQLMRTEDASLFAVWMDAWKDLVGFQIVPVRTSAEAAEVTWLETLSETWRR